MTAGEPVGILKGSPVSPRSFLEVHIGFEERPSDLTHGLVNVGL